MSKKTDKAASAAATTEPERPTRKQRLFDEARKLRPGKKVTSAKEASRVIRGAARGTIR